MSPEVIAAALANVGVLGAAWLHTRKASKDLAEKIGRVDPENADGFAAAVLDHLVEIKGEVGHVRGEVSAIRADLADHIRDHDRGRQPHPAAPVVPLRRRFAR